MRTLIFLGAGASAADGAPTQEAVFREYLRSLKAREFPDFGKTQWAPEKALPSFLRDIFGIDVHRSELDNIRFPTFEEALGILELARLRRESFGQMSYQLGNRPTNWPTLEQMIFILLEVLADAIAEQGSKSSGRVHSKLCANLAAQGLLDSVTFVTTNYDSILESAFAATIAADLDYGFSADPFGSSRAGKTRVLKIHGSLDWLFCQACLSVTSRSSGKVTNEQCPVCGDFLVHLIVPPTFFKQMDHFVLSSIWASFQGSLQEADHVVFCGYSFPDADLHVKFALKRREVIWYKKPLRVTVVNQHPGKPQHISSEEKIRYQRFFREEVEYTSQGFEDLADDPASVLGRPRAAQVK